jgi:hypothetical protein
MPTVLLPKMLCDLEQIGVSVAVRSAKYRGVGIAVAFFSVLLPRIISN